MWFESCDLLGEEEFYCPTGAQRHSNTQLLEEKRADSKKVELFIIEGRVMG